MYFFLVMVFVSFMLVESIHRPRSLPSPPRGRQIHVTKILPTDLAWFFFSPYFSSFQNTKKNKREVILWVEFYTNTLYRMRIVQSPEWKSLLGRGWEESISSRKALKARVWSLASDQRTENRGRQRETENFSISINSKRSSLLPLIGNGDRYMSISWLFKWELHNLCKLYWI